MLGQVTSPEIIQQDHFCHTHPAAGCTAMGATSLLRKLPIILATALLSQALATPLPTNFRQGDLVPGSNFFQCLGQKTSHGKLEATLCDVKGSDLPGEIIEPAE